MHFVAYFTLDNQNASVCDFDKCELYFLIFVLIVSQKHKLTLNEFKATKPQ